MTPDLLNGLFEFFAGISVLFNVLRLYKDKVLKGFDWRTTAFFTSWGFYNLFYYPHLGQWLSFTGGLCIVTFNCIWLTMCYRYRNATNTNT